MNEQMGVALGYFPAKCALDALSIEEERYRRCVGVVFALSESGATAHCELLACRGFDTVEDWPKGVSVGSPVR